MLLPPVASLMPTIGPSLGLARIMADTRRQFPEHTPSALKRRSTRALLTLSAESSERFDDRPEEREKSQDACESTESDDGVMRGVVKHYLNLSNGVEAIHSLLEAGLEPDELCFCRIQSSHCEAQDFNGILTNLDNQMLLHLALGYECRVYDFGSRGNQWGGDGQARIAQAESLHSSMPESLKMNPSLRPFTCASGSSSELSVERIHAHLHCASAYGDLPPIVSHSSSPTRRRRRAATCRVHSGGVLNGFASRSQRSGTCLNLSRRGSAVIMCRGALMSSCVPSQSLSKRSSSTTAIISNRGFVK